MSTFLFLLSFPVGIAVWYFLAKRMKASGKGVSRHIAGLFAGFFAWLVVMVIAMETDPRAQQDMKIASEKAAAEEKLKQAEEQQKQEQLAQAQQNEQKQKAADEQAAEVQKLVELHQSSMSKYNEMERASVQLSNAFTAKKIDLYKAYESAENLRTLAEKVRNDVQPIELKNENANKNAKDYVDNVKTLAYIRGKIADLSMGVANGDKEFKPSDQAELKKLIGAAQTATLMAAASIMSAYDNLGIKSEQIDYENGGLKK